MNGIRKILIGFVLLLILGEVGFCASPQPQSPGNIQNPALPQPTVVSNPVVDNQEFKERLDKLESLEKDRCIYNAGKPTQDH
jgi:hypothetical protein